MRTFGKDLLIVFNFWKTTTKKKKRKNKALKMARWKQLW
jgi:hypothetical protein